MAVVPPDPGAELAIVCTGVVAPEALKALAAVREDIPGAGLLHVTSADLLDMDWRRHGRAGTAAALLAPLAPDAALVTVLDGHPATLSWLGAVLGHRVKALGVDRLGQSADLVDLYRVHALDASARNPQTMRPTRARWMVMFPPSFGRSADRMGQEIALTRCGSALNTPALGVSMMWITT